MICRQKAGGRKYAVRDQRFDVLFGEKSTNGQNDSAEREDADTIISVTPRCECHQMNGISRYRTFFWYSR